MGRKKTGAIPTVQPKEKQKMVIDMTKIELAKSYHVPGFRSGKHMTEKDRPRKKNWKKEYERGKGSDLYGDYKKEPFSFQQTIALKTKGNKPATCTFCEHKFDFLHII